MVNMSSEDEKSKVGLHNQEKFNGISNESRPCCSASSSPSQNNKETHSGSSSTCDLSGCLWAPSTSYPTTIKLESEDVNITSQHVCELTNFKRNVESCTGNKNVLSKTKKMSQPEKDEYCSGKVSCEYERNSSSEDEECCIYTYKGGDSNQMADLPSSFFRLDLVSSRAGASRNSSPDMDYLEMDFDPGPSNGRDSCSGSDCSDLHPLAIDLEQAEPQPDSTPPSPLSSPSPVIPVQPCSLGTSELRSVTSPLKQTSVPDIDSSILQPSFCYCIAYKHPPTSIDENFNEGVTSTMVWKELEAREKQVNQIGLGACGATAVVNTLLGLNVPFSVSCVKQHVATRTRAESAPLPEYLQSRCHTGATHVDMIRGLHNASNGLVYARFFHLYPERDICLTDWLAHWISKGAVPILLRNLQRGVRPGTEVPDWWHHQMVYGVSGRGVHLTNPLEVESEVQLWPQLASPSVLKVRCSDVLARWTPNTCLLPLASQSFPLWRKLNVLGQVVNVIREGSQSRQQHITIPASYCSGVILSVLRNSPAYDELRLSPDLPVHHMTVHCPT